MTTRRSFFNSYFKGGIVAVAVAAGIFIFYQANEHKLPANQSPEGFKLLKKMETESVPDFTLERLDGSKLRLADFKGKLIIVNFWASWCNPCVEEFPSMVSLGEKMKDQLVVIAVSNDEQKAEIETFAKLFQLPKPGFEIVWDKDKKIAATYGVGKLPESFIIGPDLKLKRKFVGTENWASEDALSYFRAMLASAAGDSNGGR